MSSEQYSELLSSVKSADRTPKYMILAALYCLGASEAAVQVGAVERLMRLHLGSKTPSGISDKLRKYSKEVSPVGAKPLRWKLSKAGRELFSAHEGLTVKDVAFGCDVGVVCALEEPEFSAVMECLDGQLTWTEIDDNNSSIHVYRRCELKTVDGGILRIVGTTASSMGLTAAAIVTTQLVLKYRPRLVVMIGIAAGTKPGAMHFGDILVADPSIDYNSGKIAEVDGVREFFPDSYPLGLHPRLRSVVRKYVGRNHPILNSIKLRHKSIAPQDQLRVHLGPFGTGDQVVDDGKRIEEIRSLWRKLIGIDMETYAVYRACDEAPEPQPRVVSFKSICDFAASKSDSWQRYAACVAADFAFEFLRHEWSSLWLKLEEDGKHES